jgi:hypothetical protein
MAKKKKTPWGADDEAADLEVVESGDFDLTDTADAETQKPIKSRLPMVPVQQDAEEEDKVVGKMECPQHLFTISIREDKKNVARNYAVCDCNVRSNMWKGRIVWEHTQEADS